MSIRIPITWGPRGLVRDRASGPTYATWFFSAAGVPLVPSRGVELDVSGVARPAPLRVDSLLLAYWRTWGLLVSALFAYRADWRFDIGGSGGWLNTGLAFGALALTVASWSFKQGFARRGVAIVTAVGLIPAAFVAYFTIRPAHEHAEYVQRTAENDSRAQDACRADAHACSDAGRKISYDHPELAAAVFESGCTRGDDTSCIALEGSLAKQDRSRVRNALDRACKIGDSAACSRIKYLAQ
jgi:hypothetical protein